MAYRKKTNTKLSVDQILDGAADILEAHGVVHGACHDSVTGGHCALGAIARVVYPKATTGELGELAYVDNHHDMYARYNARNADPTHIEAVHFFAGSLPAWSHVGRPIATVTYFNDELEYTDASAHPFLTVKSSKKVVAKFRSAAKAYRKQHAA